MKTTVALTVLCLLAGMPALRAAPPPAQAWTLAIYKLSEQTAHCPANMHAKLSCVELKGKVLSAGAWPEMQRIAAVDAASLSGPPGCVTATTTGSLAGKDGTLHFKGAGYYCPTTDTAWYRLDFNTADAKRFNLPPHGSTRYVGKTNIETFTIPSECPHQESLMGSSHPRKRGQGINIGFRLPAFARASFAESQNICALIASDISAR